MKTNSILKLGMLLQLYRYNFYCFSVSSDYTVLSKESHCLTEI